MTKEAFFLEIRRSLRGLQLVVGTLLLATAIYSWIVVLLVGIYPPDLAITTVLSMGLIVVLVVPLLIARAILPGKMIDQGVRRIAAGDWADDALPGSATDELILRTGDAGRLWQLYMTQTLVGSSLVTAAGIASLSAYMVDPSMPPLALGTLLVVAISSHFPTKPIVARWLAIYLRVLEVLRR